MTLDLNFGGSDQFFVWYRLKTPVETALKDANLSIKDIDEVVLVGGSTRIPAVQELVKKMTGKDPNVTVNPVEVVALGASVQVCVQSLLPKWAGWVIGPGHHVLKKCFGRHYTNHVLFESFDVFPFITIILEKPKMDAQGTWSFQLLVLILNSLCTFALNLSVFLVIQHTSALTIRVAGIVKDWVVVLLSALLFADTKLTLINIFGYAPP